MVNPYSINHYCVDIARTWYRELGKYTMVLFACALSPNSSYFLDIAIIFMFKPIYLTRFLSCFKISSGFKNGDRFTSFSWKSIERRSTGCTRLSRRDTGEQSGRPDCSNRVGCCNGWHCEIMPGALCCQWHDQLLCFDPVFDKRSKITGEAKRKVSETWLNGFLFTKPIAKRRIRVRLIAQCKGIGIVCIFQTNGTTKWQRNSNFEYKKEPYV